MTLALAVPDSVSGNSFLERQLLTLRASDKLPHYTTLQKFSARSQVLAIADAMIRTIGRAAGAAKFAKTIADPVHKEDHLIFGCG